MKDQKSLELTERNDLILLLSKNFLQKKEILSRIWNS